MTRNLHDPERGNEAREIYFDHNATTPLDPRVRDAMLPWLGERHGNPSSAHRAGRAARKAVEKARRQVAGLLGAEPADLVFTASGSEANNAVVAAIAEAAGHRGHLVISALEHPSIRAAAERAAGRGMEVSEVSPGPDGRVDPGSVEKALRGDTRLVCLMLANNELGTLQPLAEVAAVCHDRGVPVLTDAVQAVGKIPVDVRDVGADYLTLGGHKFHGPFGAAALWVRPGAHFAPLVVGAPQEGGRRAGTEDVPALVGLGRACELARRKIADRERYLGELRSHFEEGLERIAGARIHCADSPRLPHTSHVAFEGVSGHELMLRLDERGIAVSTGSACHSGQPQPSRTLLAMGIGEEEALASLRVSFGLPNTRSEIDVFLEALGPLVPDLQRHQIQRNHATAAASV